MTEVRLITLAPGHFHAALVQKVMYPNVAKQVHVYASLDADLPAHLSRIAGFNHRRDNPTEWELEVHAGPDFLQRLLREKPGNVVVLSGRNRDKLRYLEAAVGAGLHVLADKPWVLVPEDLTLLETVLNEAASRGLVAYDIMTERYEITSILQRELVRDAGVFGSPVAGTEAEPGVRMESKHFLMKLVAGLPNRRPAWFFDVHQQGEGLTDVGTHLVDLVPWILFPDQALDHRREVQVLSARRWPTVLTRTDFHKVTGETDFPEGLRSQNRGDAFDYFCNTQVRYKVRGVHVRLDVLWDFESTAGAGDTHYAVFRGTRSRVEVRQGPAENYRPEVYVVPADGGSGAVEPALHRWATALQGHYPGVEAGPAGGEFRLAIPDAYRVGHEAHFGAVARQFLAYLRTPRAVPPWERPNMLAKYYVTTEGVRRSRQSSGERGEVVPLPA